MNRTFLRLNPYYHGTHLRQILRRLLQRPLFTAVTVFTLALGIGANVAIFSVVEGVLLKPLPYLHADRLVILGINAPGINLYHAGSSAFLYFTYREQGRVFDDVGMWHAQTGSVTGLAEPEEVPSMVVTQGVLPILGAVPAHGRLFTADDDSPNSEQTVILTAGYWRSHFGGDPSTIGKRLVVNGSPRQIIGVLADGFRFLDSKTAIVLPWRLDPDKVFVGGLSDTVVARLKLGVTIAQATAEIGRLIPIALDKYPPFPGFSRKMFEEAKLTPDVRLLKDEAVGDVGSVLWVLMGTIGLVLLIACANVANLLLVRSEGRQQELAVRSALGASRRRIAYELLAESIVLGLLGGAAALGVAYGALRMLVMLAPGNLPRLDNITIDNTVLLFTLAVSLIAGLLFGVIPVFKYVGPNVASGLRGNGRVASAGRERQRARATLVVVQVALAVVLLIGAGLMIRTFEAVRRVTPGFTNPESMLTFGLLIPSTQVKEPVAVIRMHQSIMGRIAAIPGVTSVGLTSTMPMSGPGWHDPIFASDKRYEQTTLPPIRLFKFVSPGLLKTMGTPLVAGRDLTWEDVYDSHTVAMVSENMARELWGSPSAALGRRIRESLKSDWREVVGVVGDVRDDGMDKKAVAAAYFPMMMKAFEGDVPFYRRSMNYVVRSRRAGSQTLATDVGRAVWTINPNLPLANIRTVEAVVSASMSRTSFVLVMLAIAGAMALLLGVAGLYGVIAYSVSQRKKEIGIRMALGAQRADVTRMFVRYGLTLGAVGIGIGFVAALALTRLMASLLFEVGPADPVTYVAVCTSLVGAAVLASYVPALRATLLDPVTALRSE